MMFGWLKPRQRIEVNGSASFPNVDKVGGVNVYPPPQSGYTIGVDFGKGPDSHATFTRTATQEPDPGPRVERSKAFKVKGKVMSVDVDRGTATVRQGGYYGIYNSLYVEAAHIPELITLLQAAQREMGNG